MKSLDELRTDARKLLAAAMRAANAGAAVRRAVRWYGSILEIGGSRIDLAQSGSGTYVVAIGKAAPAMSITIDEVLGDRICGGVISGSASTNSVTRSKLVWNRWQFFAGGHPLPNRESFAAANAAIALLKKANIDGSPILFMISGGGSAMLELPRNERISLEDLRVANQLLVTCGATINEINAVRSAFSAIKGGGLARLAPRSPQISLIVSDTNTGDESSVASGPTFERTDNPNTAKDVVTRYEQLRTLPASVLDAINSPGQSRPTSVHPFRAHHVLIDNRTALRAAASAANELGFQTAIATDIVEQEVNEGIKLLLSRLSALRRQSDNNRSVCLISGGEFRCPVTGTGQGGRNAETVLRLALDIEDATERIVALSAGTDGIDGNSPAAGAIADNRTLERARRIALDSRSFLENSDSFSFFDRLGDAIITGGSGTNVRDIRILLAD